jgi:hypothetical protein
MRMSFGYNIDYNSDFINHVDQTHLLINFERKIFVSIPPSVESNFIRTFSKPRMLNLEKKKEKKNI